MVFSAESIYNALLVHPGDSFVQTKEGIFLPFKRWMSEPAQTGQSLHVYSGSFNPLHDGHLGIFKGLPDTGYRVDNNSSMYRERGVRAFEMSLTRVGKGTMSMEEMKERLAQFIGVGDIILTNVAKFVEKAGVLRPYIYALGGLNFHVGADTMERLLSNLSIEEVQGYSCNFVIHNRIMNGERVKVADNLPLNCQMALDRPEEEMKLSSTAIRMAKSHT